MVTVGLTILILRQALCFIPMQLAAFLGMKHWPKSRSRCVEVQLDAVHNPEGQHYTCIVPDNIQACDSKFQQLLQPASQEQRDISLLNWYDSHFQQIHTTD